MLRFDADRAITFSWTDKLENGEVAKTTVAFMVVRKGRGTLLELRHTDFKDPEHFVTCASKCVYFLTDMKPALDHGLDLRSEFDS